VAWTSGGVFCMGSDRSYSEKVPVHQVSGFWIERKPVTSRQFKQFVRTTGHKTFAEILTDPKAILGVFQLLQRSVFAS
jgi:formylglycine-generating enzyme